MKQKPKPWGDTEVRLLHRLHRPYMRTAELGMAFRAVSEGPQRSDKAVYDKCKLEGLSFSARHSRRASNRWPEPLETALTRLWNVEKLSASQCAERLGVTRNAVIGKAHRLGLEARPDPIKRAKPLDFRGLISSEHKCQWPDGCGKDPVPGKPYCEEHLARAYQKPQRREKPPQEFRLSRFGGRL